MKSKPLIFSIAGVLILAACLFLFLKSKNIKEPHKDEVMQFLSRFNEALKTNNKDLVATYIDNSQLPVKELAKFMDVFSGKKLKSGRTDISFASELIIDESVVKVLNPELLEISTPVHFTYNDLEIRKSSLVFKIRTPSPGKFVITRIDTRKFLPDHIAYENYVASKTLRDEDIYSPLTLKAFAAVDKITYKYDSVLWFAHLNNQTYYYVLNGKWNIYNEVPDTVTAKMGLLDPQLKEIIPAEYDLVHNINGTFKGMVEVEKNYKRGFYNLQGTLIVPVEYDQVFPVKKADTLAVLRKDDDYYWLKSDNTISEKTELKIADVLAQMPQYGNLNIVDAGLDNVTEANSREEHGSIYVPPSYLVDLNITPALMYFRNPLRKNIEFYDMSKSYNIKADKALEQQNENPFIVAFYSIRDYFLGGRAEFYDRKNIVLIDKKRNRVFGGDVVNEGAYLDVIRPEKCNEYSLKPLNDSIFEVKVSSNVYVSVPGEDNEYLNEAPLYHYLYIKGNKLVESLTTRVFGFTKFVKMDESYLNGCYVYRDSSQRKTSTDRLKPVYLQFLKNEIYADYHYKFKNEA